jgi:hypothetical protein
MRSAANFNPEWGYLAPAPSFVRTVRIAVVAAAVGATAGAAVVFSLIDRPEAVESVAARTLAAETLSAPAAPVVALQTQQPVPALANAPGERATSAESGTTTTTQHPASSAVLAESPPATDAALTAIPAKAANVKWVRQPQTSWHAATGWHAPAPNQVGRPADRGPLALLRSPGAPAYPSTYYPPHGEY